MEANYLLALTTGLLGGFGHCIGMCGPLVASVSMARKPAELLARERALSQLLYNLGRVTTYVAVGAAMGLTGSFVNMAGRLAGVQDVVAIAAGILILVTGIDVTLSGGAMRSVERHNRTVLEGVKRILKGRSPFRYYTLGLLLGLLPCGLSYSIFIAAAGTGQMMAGAVTLFCFGLGTIPALLLFGLLVDAVSLRVRGWIYRAGGVSLMVMGVVFLMRGFHV